MRSRIFVGSSTEALGLAHRVAEVIRQAGMTAGLWDTEAFPVGTTLLERIESLSDEVDGAPD